ncbi:hypothetical protein CAPTEDRAFT_215225 [Capitella teleta]|uniref:Uncharacterized protein n=1 Tax=Capitella teleta TaxID=283909 RepID=R7VLA3_CAPTE|nr:hypothetical protein CAPTEDRAFT_215225 [Capitella teleta]|eukprot:ELU17450.1 hypothetical protein CAPTEDRAFT_215225 [Capitella teleta]
MAAPIKSSYYRSGRNANKRGIHIGASLYYTRTNGKERKCEEEQIEEEKEEEVEEEEVVEERVEGGVTAKSIDIAPSGDQLHSSCIETLPPLYVYLLSLSSSAPPLPLSPKDPLQRNISVSVKHLISRCKIQRLGIEPICVFWELHDMTTARRWLSRSVQLPSGNRFLRERKTAEEGVCEQTLRMMNQSHLLAYRLNYRVISAALNERMHRFAWSTMTPVSMDQHEPREMLLSTGIGG